MKELTLLRAENEEQRATIATKVQILVSSTDSDFGQTHKRPIDRIERQALAIGAAEQLLGDLQQELQICKQQKEELQHQLQ